MERELMDIGLTQKEAQTYLALSRNPDSTGTSLSKFLTFDRRTVYDNLHSLFQKGYVKQYDENKTKKYSIVNSSLLLREAEERKNKIEKLIPQLQSIIPDVEHKVEILKGRRGFILVYDEIVENKLDHCTFGSISFSVEKLVPLVNEYLQKLEKLGCSEKVIFEKGYDYTPIKGGEYRFLDKSMVPPTTSLIYGDVVVLFLNDPENTMIRIQSKEIVKAYISYFNVYWNIAEKE